MPKKHKTAPKNIDKSDLLKANVEETEETLEAIRQDMVDALLVTRANGARVVTFNDADFPYRLMVESMSEGAVTLIPDGTIFYCNSRFCEMVQIENEALVGTSFRSLLPPDEQSAFDALFSKAGQEATRGEFCLKKKDGMCFTVQLSMYQLRTDAVIGISIIVTDLTERIQAEEKIRNLASKLTVAEQEERQRISQVLHDDLQQRLFAIKAQLSFLSGVEQTGDDSQSAYFSLDEIQSALSEAIAVTRNLSIDMSPVILQGEGLIESMKWLSSRMAEQYGLRVQIDAKENLDKLDHHVRLVLFQAVRELLFNIVKHAGTPQATVTLERDQTNGRIIVSDTGKGFDAETVLKNPLAAHGLLVIQDRLGLLGCTMNIISKPGNGTRVSIEAPLGNISE